MTLEQLEAASAFDDEKDVEAVLAAGDGWAGKADQIRRRVEREEAKAEDYDAFGDADETDLSILYLCTHGVLSSSDDGQVYLMLGDGENEAPLGAAALAELFDPSYYLQYEEDIFARVFKNASTNKA